MHGQPPPRISKIMLSSISKNLIIINTSTINLKGFKFL